MGFLFPIAVFVVVLFIVLLVVAVAAATLFLSSFSVVVQVATQTHDLGTNREEVVQTAKLNMSNSQHRMSSSHFKQHHHQPVQCSEMISTCRVS